MNTIDFSGVLLSVCSDTPARCQCCSMAQQICYPRRTHTPVCGISVVGISGSMFVALASDILGEVCV